MANSNQDLKAEVQARWLAGGVSKKALAREYNVDPATIRRWTGGDLPPPPGTFPVPPRAPKASTMAVMPVDLGTKVLQLVNGLADAALEVLQLAQDPEWLRSRTPNDLHRWFESWTDRTILILGALERGEEIRAAREAAIESGRAGPEADEVIDPPLGPHFPSRAP